MDFRDQVFLSAAEHLNLSKASEEMFISQPAVTRHIKELESKMNTALFERKGNKIYLTEAGKITYSFLKQIKQKYNEMDFQIGRINNTFQGSLRMGASSTISQYIIPSTLASFNTRYPNINLCMRNGNSFQMESLLLEKSIDLALVENEASHPNLRYFEFMDDEIVAVTNNKSLYSKNAHLSVHDLREVPVVLREKGSGTLEVIQRALSKQGLTLDKMNIVMHLGSTESIKSFLADFDGIALVSNRAITNEYLLKNIKIVPIKGLKINRQLRVAVRQGPTQSAVDLFIEFIRNYNF